MNEHKRSKEQEGYRYYASCVKSHSRPVRVSPYEIDCQWDNDWKDGYDLAEYDDYIGDLEDEL